MHFARSHWLIPVSVTLIVALAVAFYLRGARWAADTVADTVYGHVFEPADSELPVTIVNYPSSPETLAVIGGRGAGLDCSIPRIANIAFKRAANSAPVTLQFRQACAFHDLCYRHGLATYGYMQADCDYLLQEQAFRICRNIVAHGKEDADRDCRRDAKKVLLGVRLGGFKPFHDWETSTYYEFDPFPKKSMSFDIRRLVPRLEGAKPATRLDLLKLTVGRSAIHTECEFCPTGVPKDLPWDPHRTLMPGGLYAAPQMLSLPGKDPVLVWITRALETNTSIRLEAMT